uniref:Breast cancer metastasis-suppressor 1-like protein-A n=1 Tax=Strigamia maritima TaxID=126957 RepID=T1JDS8_STRMM
MNVEMPVIKEDVNDSDGEDMDQDTLESEKSTNDDSVDTSAGSEDDSSEMDEVECERRRTECLVDMADLETQFSYLKEQERMTQVDTKLAEVRSGKAAEYIQPLEELKLNVLRKLKLNNIQNKFDAETLASRQNYESEKAILRDTIQSELEEKIRRLEEDKNNIDITSDLKNEQANHKKNRRKTDSTNPDKRKKPVTVSGPYIVYMLHDNDILEDWTAIRKALKASKRKCECKLNDEIQLIVCASVVKLNTYRSEENQYNARFADGKLLFEGQSFCKGHHIIIENKEDSPLLAHITAINTSEVVLKRHDGNRFKLSITDLQVGKYAVRHCPS